jgi:hypothetical protein
MSSLTNKSGQIPRRLSLLRLVRPSLLDLRFTGDPWIVCQEDDICVICLGDTLLGGIRAGQLDLPSLNHAIDRLRHPRHRRRRG